MSRPYFLSGLKQGKSLNLCIHIEGNKLESEEVLKLWKWRISQKQGRELKYMALDREWEPQAEEKC